MNSPLSILSAGFMQKLDSFNKCRDLREVKVLEEQEQF